MNIKLILSFLLIFLNISTAVFSEEITLKVVQLPNQYETNVLDKVTMKYIDWKWTTIRYKQTNITEYRCHGISVYGIKTNTMYCLYAISHLNHISKQYFMSTKLPYIDGRSPFYKMNITKASALTNTSMIYFVRQEGNKLGIIGN
jgi:hypothetical protein